MKPTKILLVVPVLALLALTALAAALFLAEPKRLPDRLVTERSDLKEFIEANYAPPGEEADLFQNRSRVGAWIPGIDPLIRKLSLLPVKHPLPLLERLFNWNPFWEPGSAGGINSLYQPGVLELFRHAPDAPQTMDGAITLLRWFQRHQRSVFRPVFVPITPALEAQGPIYCDHRVSMFRTLLAYKGFNSRTVAFEFDDAVGGNSHTFLEVLDPERRQWRYVDPHHYAFSTDSATYEIMAEKRRVALDPIPADETDLTTETRLQALENLFRRGWRFWIIQNSRTQNLQVFRHPETYPGKAPPTSFDGKRGQD